MSARALAKLERKASRRAVPRPNVLSALVEGRGAAYTRTRFSIPIVRASLLAFLHFVEWGILSQLLEPEFLGPILALRVVFSIVAGLGSSLLEPVRMELRHLRDAGESSTLAIRSDVAWTRAWWSGAAFSVASVVFIALAPQMGRGTISVVDAFLIAAVVRCASSWALRAYESGLQAFGRIPRSPSLFIVLDVFENLGPILLWRVFGPWAIPAVSIASSAMSFALGRFYAHRAFAAKGVRPPKRLALSDSRLRDHFQMRTVFRAAGVGLALELPNVFLAVTLAASSVSALAIGVYTLRPLLAVLLHAARLYYADFARIGFLGPWGEKRLIAHVRRVLIVATAFVLAAGMAIAVAFAASPLAFVGIALVLLVSALFTIEVVASFFRERTRSMTVMALLGFVGAVVTLLVRERVVVTAGLFPCIALATWWLAAQREKGALRHEPPRTEMPALDFLAWVSARPELEIWRLEVHSRERAAALRVQRALSAASHVSSLWRRTVLFVACPGGTTHHELLVRTSGLVSAVARVSAAALGDELLSIETTLPQTAGEPAFAPVYVPPKVGTLGDLYAATQRGRRGPFGGPARFGDYEVVVRFAQGEVASLSVVDSRLDAASRKAQRDAAWVENVRGVLSSSERARRPA